MDQQAFVMAMNPLRRCLKVFIEIAKLNSFAPHGRARISF